MSEEFIEIPANKISENVFDLIGEQWMLITAGDKKNFNTMTAAWGGLGFLWKEPAATIFIRPQRYTYEFVEKYEDFTLSFFNKDYKKALASHNKEMKEYQKSMGEYQKFMKKNRQQTKEFENEKEMWDRLLKWAKSKGFK